MAVDIVPGDTSSTVALTELQIKYGEIDTAGDQDWYRIELTAGQNYYFQLIGDGPIRLADPVLELRNAAGVLVASDDDSGPGKASVLGFAAQTTGTYYISAKAFTGVDTGGYTITFDNWVPPSDGTDNDPAVNVPLAAGDIIYVYFAPSGFTTAGRVSNGWDAANKQLALHALQTISEVIPVNFVETTNSAIAQFNVGLISDASIAGVGGLMTYPGQGAQSGQGWFNTASAFWPNGMHVGGTVHEVFLHEFGHALGLKHPHEFSTEGLHAPLLDVTAPFNDYGLYDFNQSVYSVMSYNSGWRTGPMGGASESSFGHAGSLGPLDIVTLQEKYGVRDHNVADTLYELPTGNAPGVYYRTIWDTGGVDEIRVSGNYTATIDLRMATNTYTPGGAGRMSYAVNSNGGFLIAYGVIIENATGSIGSDTLIGNNANNVLDGGGFNDSMTGGAGNDTYIVDYRFVTGFGDVFEDQVFENANEGTDTVRTSVDYDLATRPHVENIVATGFNNSILGNEGNNVLDGREAAGDNLMVGRGGDDTYYSDGTDRPMEDPNQGNDTIYVLAAVNYSLVGTNIENAILLGTAAASLGGTDGVDFLDVEQNTAANLVVGANGSDTYAVGAGDRVAEELNEGNDTVTSRTISLDLRLSAYDNVENASLFGSSALNLDGNAIANVLTGNAGANTLRGNGGADTLRGLAGNDLYYIDSLDDVIHEAAGSTNGTQDTVITTVNVRLDTTTTAQGIEHVGITGTANVTVVGSSTFNVINGNSGANYLAGYGGNDTVSGGAGNDRVFGGDGKDTLTGGTGDDAFLYSFIADSGGTQARRDVITDFRQIAGNNDWIDLSLTDANGAVAGNQAFVWRGTAAFTGAAGELRYFQDAANNRTIIEGNVRVTADSPGPEFSLELTGLYTLAAGADNTFDIIL